jgi:hypothetical protein
MAGMVVFNGLYMKCSYMPRFYTLGVLGMWEIFGCEACVACTARAEGARHRAVTDSAIHARSNILCLQSLTVTCELDSNAASGTIRSSSAGNRQVAAWRAQLAGHLLAVSLEKHLKFHLSPSKQSNSQPSAVTPAAAANVDGTLDSAVCDDERCHHTDSL